jgi:hypothetical protein
LFSKETGISFFVMVVCLIICKQFKENTERLSASLRRAMILISPFALAVGLYLAIRAVLGIQGAGFGPGRYGLNIGVNVVRNIAMFLFQAVLPASSVDTFIAVRSRDAVALTPILLGCLVIAAAVVFGLWKSERRGHVVWLGLFGLLGLFPAVLMNNVSELYLYNSMPFFSALIGIGIGRIIAVSGRGLIRATAVVLMALWLIVHVSAVRSKAAMMQHNGERSTRLLEAIRPHVADVPSGGELLLVVSRSPRSEYSVFLMEGFNVLHAGLHRIRELSGRVDFDVRIITEDRLAQELVKRDVLILSSDGEGNVRQVRPEDESQMNADEPG